MGERSKTEFAPPVYAKGTKLRLKSSAYLIYLQDLNARNAVSVGAGTVAVVRGTSYTNSNCCVVVLTLFKARNFTETFEIL